MPEREQRILDLLAVDSQQCVTKLEKDSGIKNILTVIKSLLDKEAIFVKEELRRTYKPKTEEMCIRDRSTSASSVVGPVGTREERTTRIPCWRASVSTGKMFW